jgi:succinyl-CoA synthetase beta subunit
MKIHEYQAKEILRRYKVPVPMGRNATTLEEAEAIAIELGGKVVVKAQIHAGGRGKGGGVKLANSVAEAREHAEAILGMTLITHQTGPEGRVVKKLLVEEASSIARELYLGVVIDRATERVVMMGSTEGGVEIEKVAAETPEKILKVFIDPAVGMQAHQARWLAFGLGLDGACLRPAVSAMLALYKAFMESDASITEINPLIVTEDDKVVALDAKMNFDDNALYRHPDIAELRDLDEEEPLEIEASKYDLNYIKLDGKVGCMVNGAGLAMATMDIIKLAGSEPANFLDVGGGASVERVCAAFRILMSDPNVKAVLINIFGGIVRCDRVAGGVIEALKQVKVTVPIVVRLEGTNRDEAKRMLQESGMDFIVAYSGLADAAEKVVAALQS